MKNNQTESKMDADIDFDKLLKLRLVVARQGEMDVSRWWNTKGMLSRNGTIVLGRGFPRTHYFAQARIIFAVARARCREVFSPPGCITLWDLPAQIEDQFESNWITWLNQSHNWEHFFKQLEAQTSGELLKSMKETGLLTDEHAAEVEQLRRSAENRAVLLPHVSVPNNSTFTLLAAGFSKGELGSPAIPYARMSLVS
jgi:hypothetical protein